MNNTHEPHVLRHFLASIQLAIGNLKADTAPIGKAKVEATVSHPRPGDVFREYSWTTERFHVFSLKMNLFALPAEVDLKDATRAEIVVEIANQHMGFEGMAIRLNGNQWYPIQFPTSSPTDPSPSVWFHHWYPTILVSLSDLKEGKGNTFEMKVPAECFDGKIHPNGAQPLPPWCPVYGVTVRVYYDPARKPHPTGKVLAPAAQSSLGLAVDLKASAQSDNGPIRQVDFLGRYEDINYEGDGVYDQWHGHLFHGKITHHLGSTKEPDAQVTWDTSWVPDQPDPMEIAARITDATGLIYMTEAVEGLKLVRPGLSVELCKPFDVPRSFTGCQYGEWVISGIRTQKFTIKGDLSKAADARYVIASWGNQKECLGYTINGVALEDKPAGADYYYNLSTPPIRPLTVLKAGENTFATVVAKGRMPDIYMPGVQVLIRYRTVKANAFQTGTTPGREIATESEAVTTAPQWQEVQLSFAAIRDVANPYTDTEAWADFTHDDGTKIRRPMFWDSGRTFRVRFASTKSSGNWRWTTTDRNGDPGIQGRSGTLEATANQATVQTHFSTHGFWSIPPGGRNLIHADSTPRLLCADTVWALPWRATVEQAETYARDRQAKGFNAALLMTVQPDMDCKGPRSRTEDLGFDVGFEDLPKGTLRQLRPEYFQMFDRLTGILVAHGIAPVYQPVFHGYGWKGRRTAGPVVSAEDYARYCRYLVARFGARPAIWLVGGDNPATAPAVVEQLGRAGRTIKEWDAYHQPTGIHYAPHSLFRTHQDKAWLDFQWCQTGHNGEHVPERVADMWRNTPVKAVANGEPTYENIGKTGRGAGWWQGHEAWCNLTAGGTMGLVYGAGSLWQWRLHANEPDHADWCTAPGFGWREALDFEGSRYPGIAAKIFDGLPFADMQPNWTYTYGRRGLAVPGKLFVLYLPEGGGTGITSLDVPRAYRIYDPRTGQEVGKGRLPDQAPAQFDSGSSGEPRVVVFTAAAP